mgnify:CR=1 FL=1
MDVELTDKLRNAISILQEKLCIQLNMSIEDVRNLQIRVENDKVTVYAKEKPVEPTVVEPIVEKVETDYV